MGTQKAIAEQIIEKKADYLLALKGNQGTLHEDVHLYCTEERRFYISSLQPQARFLGDVIRKHWGIENSLHWVLDVAFREDECRKRKDNSAENFAMLRHLTLNLLKQEKSCKRSIAGKRLLAGWDESYLEKILFQG
jgi:predicted transposase YbfD/YdcC